MLICYFLLFVVYVLCRPAMLYCLFVAALWSPAVEVGGGGTGLLALLYVVFSCVLSLSCVVS